MPVLCQTAAERLVDSQGRPYFLWDVDMTLEEFVKGLGGSDVDVRAYLVAKLMRQAKPDDVFLFVRRADLEALWPRIERLLGKKREMWRWLLDRWNESEHAGR